MVRKEKILIGTGFLLHDEIGGVYVHPDHQRNGVGRLVVDILINKAKENRLNYVWLDSTPLAKSLYLNLGFSVHYGALQMIGNSPLHYFRMGKKI